MNNISEYPNMNLKYNSGVYLLEILLHKSREIEIGARGRFEFPAGYYYYCGSAQRNLKARIDRHRSQSKKLYWHIDYLLQKADLIDFYTWDSGRSGECKLASYLQNNINGNIIVKGFGASDCDCKSHLFYFKEAVRNKVFKDCILDL